jgi:multiple sugar transport system permease protein
MMGFFYRLSVLLVFALSLSAAPAFGGDVKIPLKLFQIPDPKNPDPFMQADVAVLRAFMKKYPNIEPKSFSGITIQGMGMDSKILMAIAGDNAPDVVYVNFRQSDTYISQGFLWPMDEYIKKSIPEKELKERIPGPIWPVIQREGPAIGPFKEGEHIWSFPYNIVVRVMVYRKDVFEEYGIKRPPANWKELYDCVRILSDPGKSRYGIFLGSGPHASWYWISFIWTAGGDAVAKNSKGEWEAVFNSDATVSALEYYLRLNMERWTDADGVRQCGYALRGGDNTAWEEGRVPINFSYMDAQSLGKGIDPSLIGFAPVPMGPGGTGGSEINAPMMGIFSDIKGRINTDGIYVPADKIRDAAWTYINYYTSLEAEKIRVDKMVEAGYGKFLNPALLRKHGYADYAKYVPKEWEDVFNDALKNGKPEPYGKNCSMVYEYMTFPMEEAFQRARMDENFLMNNPNLRADLKAILDTAVDRANKKMLGKISPEEKRFRNFSAGVVAILIMCAFCYALWRIWKVFSPPKNALQEVKKDSWGFRKYAFAYILMIPAVASIILWFYMPMLIGSKIVFQDYRFVGDSVFVGLDNIAAVIFSGDWWSAVWNTFRYMFLMLTLGFVPSIILAVLLQEVSHGKIFYRVIYYLPAVLSSLVVIYLWKLFYEPSRTGVLNQIYLGFASIFGYGYIEPIAWLEDPRYAMLCCVIPTIWAGMGPGCLIYLAALKGIPPDLYEAAAIDGCSFFQKIRYVTLPSIKVLIVIQFIGHFISAAQNAGMILIMTYGGANTEVAELHIFKNAYINLSFGTSICMAWMLGVLILFFTLHQLKMLSKVEFKSNATKGAA